MRVFLTHISAQYGSFVWSDRARGVDVFGGAGVVSDVVLADVAEVAP